jgi:alpha-ketoglutarate-dependent taurine dioxygenase
MSAPQAPFPPRRIPRAERKLVHLSSDDLVRVELPEQEIGLPVGIRPGVDGVDLTTWAGGNQARLDDLLARHGAILFRDFAIAGIPGFERLIEAVSGGLLDYRYRSTPRKHISGRIFSSTEYPADQFIPLHNELSYTTAWPMKIWFYCVQPAASGGETPIADSRKIIESIDPSVVERFARLNVMYVRNYGEGVDLPWQEVFQTASKADVEDACRTMGLAFEWKSTDRLRTRQICQAVATHPKTGARVWFNQAHLFHISRLKAAMRHSLLATFAEDDLPRNVYYGDGSPIDGAVIDHVSDVCERHAVVFPWKQGDLLLLDNMLAAHGRRPFEGPRKVVVGMAETVHA